eukprot:CAMPEP_0174261856 /NCGR_PEP_ID=MMETSP0439-20130205/12509_1 /TAXON_ID=0 /ORGANISM="Stereomyxa ramosa, Strain Chinc5" /LENGTH=321 /DNA_ID=CAMNT_0015346455 /DNA_START=95 /DNA_END=1057 /DNA_ORIENTATION=-
MKLTALIVVLLFGTCLCVDRVLITPDFGWALLAWGFDSGGQDNTTGMKVVDVDLDEQEDLIQDLLDDGHIVLCYFSGGTIEDFRPDYIADPDAWEALAAGELDAFDETWLDIRQLEDLKDLMGPRFERAVEYGCHGVEPDNIDCYDNEDCWSGMTSPSVSDGDEIIDDQIAYNKWMAEYAHSLGLSIAMKNAVGLIDDLVDYYDCAINEQCQTYDECDLYSDFDDQNKLVMNVEYTSSSDWCDGAEEFSLKTKHCSGSDEDGVCQSGEWTNCFARADTLPDTDYTNSTTGGDGDGDGADGDGDGSSSGSSASSLSSFLLQL